MMRLHLAEASRNGRESQRDSATKPRVARNELPWENATTGYNPERVVAEYKHKYDAKKEDRPQPRWGCLKIGGLYPGLLADSQVGA